MGCLMVLAKPESGLLEWSVRGFNRVESGFKCGENSEPILPSHAEVRIEKSGQQKGSHGCLVCECQVRRGITWRLFLPPAFL